MTTAVEKVAQAMLASSDMIKKLPIVINHPMCENWHNLVTLSFIYLDLAFISRSRRDALFSRVKNCSRISSSGSSRCRRRNPKDGNLGANPTTFEFTATTPAL
jgi:hypothetical protein